MITITTTDDSAQSQSVVLQDGSAFQLTIYYVPMQYGWFIKSIVYNDFTLNGLRISNSPNMLHQFKNQIPFGVGCQSKANREPSQVEDFSSGASTLYLLTEAECIQYAEYLNG